MNDIWWYCRWKLSSGNFYSIWQGPRSNDVYTFPLDNFHLQWSPSRRRHRVETYRDVTSVPTFFVRMLGKLLDACIWLDDNLMTTRFKLAEHAQLIIFRPIAWKNWVHDNVIFRSVYNGQLRLCMSYLLCDGAKRRARVLIPPGYLHPGKRKH
jgi:hypothetical protein